VRADPPNDLSLYGKKLGGVLVEASLQGNRGGPVIVGIGINVNNPLPEELASTAISLREALKREVDLTETLDIVLAALDDLLEERKWRG
jgi:BirA family biotin operon repressor/biotin-[acetyl-CoA-carboxylase] ligase